jgi:hypothetical protein
VARRSKHEGQAQRRATQALCIPCARTAAPLPWRATLRIAGSSKREQPAGAIDRTGPAAATLPRPSRGTRLSCHASGRRLSGIGRRCATQGRTRSDRRALRVRASGGAPAVRAGGAARSAAHSITACSPVCASACCAACGARAGATRSARGARRCASTARSAAAASATTGTAASAAAASSAIPTTAASGCKRTRDRETSQSDNCGDRHQ